MGSCACIKKASNKSSVTYSSEEFKIKGNECFRQGDLKSAIEFYQQAIKSNPTISIYYSNTAICQYKLKDFKSAFESANKAWEKDKLNFKALVYSIKSCASLALQGNLSQFNTALAYCEELLKFKGSNKDEAIQAYAKKIHQKVTYILNHVTHTEKKNNILVYYKELYQGEIIQKLENFLAYKPLDLNGLLCPLTLEFFEEPVCLSTGNTFEKKMVHDLEKSGKLKDPLTRKSFEKNMKYFNIAVKEALEWYTKCYPDMVFHYDKGECEI